MIDDEYAIIGCYSINRPEVITQKLCLSCKDRQADRQAYKGNMMQIIIIKTPYQHK